MLFNAVFYTVFTSSFPNNYWDKFVKRKVSGLCNFHLVWHAHNLVIFNKCQPQCHPLPVSVLLPFCR